MLERVEPARTLLAATVRERRLILGMTQHDAALKAGVSDSTWLAVEQGQPVKERTLFGVDRALDWEGGSSQRVLNGGQPTEAAADAEPFDIAKELAEVRRILERIEAAQQGGDGNSG